MQNDKMLSHFSQILDYINFIGLIYEEGFMCIRDYITAKERLMQLKLRKNSKWFFYSLDLALEKRLP